MKITDLTLTLFAWRDLPAVSYGPYNPTTRTESELGLLTIATDAGIEGHAFLGSSFRSAKVDAEALIIMLKPLVVGEDAFARERIHRAMMKRARAITLRAVGAVDVALWDIVGKAANLPIHRLLGTYRTKVPTYASSPVFDTTEAYVAEALAAKEAGFKGYKIHPPADVTGHIALCRAVRQAVGVDYTLMLDSSMAYDYPTALRVGRAIEEMGYHWYEDPLPEDDAVTYTKLCAKLDIPVLATEYAPGGFHSYAPWITLKATDHLRGDVAVKGGITPVIKAAHLADGFRMNYELHHGGNSHNNIANLHVAMAIQNCEFFEVLLPDTVQKYGLLQDIEVDRDGFVHAIDRPGLGADIDHALIERNKLAVLS